MVLARKKIPATFQQAATLHQAGRFEEAAALYEAILESLPAEPDTLLNYSTLHIQRGQLAAAEPLLKKLVTVSPNGAYGHFAYANLLTAFNRRDEAATHYARATKLNPKAVEFHHNAAVNLSAMGNTEAALQSFTKANQINPDYAPSWYNRGTLEHAQRNDEAALASFNRAITLNPNYLDAYLNRALLHHATGNFAAALADSERALQLAPTNPFAHNHRGNALLGLGRHADALAAYRAASAADPDYIDPYWNAATLELTLGDFENGWRHYESRWKTPALQNVQQPAAPLWLGEEPLDGKTLYVYYEQGFGDFLQNIRYLPLLLERGATVILETFPALRRLFEASFSHQNLHIISGERPLPPFDFHCPVMSLPLAFRTTLATIPNAVPYLAVPEETQQRWQQRLGAKTKHRVGLVWSGAAHHKNDHNRSMPLETLSALMDLPFEFHSLQKEIKASDLPHLGAIKTHTEALEDFTDTAALVEQMDLVLSVDTSVAHLAGALARPLWVMLPRDGADYRWLLERTDSPWYPTARLFRQQGSERWADLIPRIAEALKTL